MSERKIRESLKAPELRPGESDMVHKVPRPDVPRPTPELWMNASTDILRWFKCDHLPEYLQVTSRLFETLARAMASTIAPGPERTIALRKLLEAKDAAVRATITPGG